MKSKKVKRLLSVLLSLSMVFTVAGCGEKANTSNEGTQSQVSASDEQEVEDNSEESSVEENPYEETIPFTFVSVYSYGNISSGYDYENDGVYKYICEKFNVEPEIWDLQTDTWEKVSAWMNGGTMPDSMNHLGFGMGAEYFDSIEQGLIRALPDGWETRWPNIAKMVDASGLSELLKVDGKTYGFPHAITGEFVESAGGTINPADHFIFRKDWAKQVGMEDLGDDYTITISEMQEYLTRVKDAGLTETPMTQTIDWFVCLMEGALGYPMTRFAQFVETENGFEFGMNMEGYSDVISEIQEWYQAGLIDPEFYALNTDYSYSVNQFYTGQTAALVCGLGAGAAWNTKNEIEKVGIIQNVDEAIGCGALVGEDGTYAQVKVHNYWGFQMFSPNTDEKTLERILDISDWMCSKEGAYVQQLGVPGIDWEYDEDGFPVLLDSDVDTGDRSMNVFAQFGGYCNDDFMWSGYYPGISDEDLQIGFDLAELREKNAVWKVSDNYCKFKGEEKNNFSMQFLEEITEIVCGSEDAETAWKRYLDEERYQWETLLNALNETYGY